MNGLDLFSGIGGLTLALAPWVRPVAYCEIEPYARAVLLSRMSDGGLPIAPIWDDVRELRGSMLGSVDIIYGGFPCQDISCAGNGVGLAGERSRLFFQIARLVGEIRPAFVFLENVPAIRTKGSDIVAGRLAGLGYDCRWDLLSAADVGALHIRDRWWLLAHTASERWEGKGSGKARERHSDFTFRREAMDNASSGRRRSSPIEICTGRHSPFDPSWWSTEPDVGRMAHGVRKRVDRLRGLGNAVVPAQAREAFRRLAGL